MIDIKKLFAFNILNKTNLVSLIIILTLFTADRITKNLIINNQEFLSRSVYINDFLNFELVWNTGIGFGLFSLEANLLYHFITLLIFIVIMTLIYLIYLNRINNKFFFSMIIGGGLGNIYDRLIYHAVPDFIDLHFNQYHWFTFNLADIFITIGIIVILMRDIIKE
ncbi:signal peptidase II [Pelagibacteraceae bacterium]|nr:signal peptidase II [Pelagibacteraceae bacterium]|tara:strand:- start:1298 stop:1795 length:498 start_codon:yes stop_codon:yes gene_type:complete